MQVPGADAGEPQALFAVTPAAGAVALNLVDRYVVPPLTVLDTRQGHRQERRRQWLGLGMRSELALVRAMARAFAPVVAAMRQSIKALARCGR